MRLLGYYLLRHVAGGVLLVLAVLALLFLLFTLVDQLRAVGRGNYTLASALAYTALTLPKLVHELAPIAVVTGTTWALTLLAARNELQVMRVCGLSRLRLAGLLAGGGGLLAVLALGNSEYLLPWAQHTAELHRHQALTGQAREQRDLWLRLGHTHVHVNRLLPGGEIDGLSAYEYAGGRLDAVVQVHSALHVDDHWQFRGLRRVVLTEDGVTLQPPTAGGPILPVALERLTAASAEPGYLRRRKRHRHWRWLQHGGQDSGRYRAAWWSRLLYAPALVLLILPAWMLATTNRLRGWPDGMRVALAMLLGIGYTLLAETSWQLALAYGNDPLPAQLAVFAAVMLPAAVMLARP